MAYEHKVLAHSFTADDGSTTYQYPIVKMTTAANTVALTTAAGEGAVGVLQDYTSSGGYVEVALLGITKLNHDGTLAPGTLIMCSTAALGTAASTGAGIYRLGTCLEAGSTVSGTVVTAFWNPGLGQSTN